MRAASSGSKAMPPPAGSTTGHACAGVNMGTLLELKRDRLAARRSQHGELPGLPEHKNLPHDSFAEGHHARRGLQHKRIAHQRRLRARWPYILTRGGNVTPRLEHWWPADRVRPPRLSSHISAKAEYVALRTASDELGHLVPAHLMPQSQSLPLCSPVELRVQLARVSPERRS